MSEHMQTCHTSNIPRYLLIAFSITRAHPFRYHLRARPGFAPEKMPSTWKIFGIPLPGSAFARYCLARVCCLHQKRHCDSLSWASFQFSDKLSCRLQDDPLWEWAGRWIGYKAGNFHARSTGLPLFSSCLRSACSQPDTSPQTSKCRASDLDLDLVLASRSRSSLAPSDTSTPITIRKETQKRERQRLQRSCTGMKKDSRLHSRWDLMATCEPWLGDRNRSHC